MLFHRPHYGTLTIKKLCHQYEQSNLCLTLDLSNKFAHSCLFFLNHFFLPRIQKSIYIFLALDQIKNQDEQTTNGGI
jgi:hypothetical protein